MGRSTCSLRWMLMGNEEGVRLSLHITYSAVLTKARGATSHCETAGGLGYGRVYDCAHIFCIRTTEHVGTFRTSTLGVQP